MTNYTYTAAGVIKDYLWKKMKEDGILKESDYIADGFTKPLIPFVFLSGGPEWPNQLPGVPYVIWDFSINGYIEDFWICEEEMTFSFVNASRIKMLEMTMYIVDVFRRMDIVAKELEEFEKMQCDNSTPGYPSEPIFNFHNIYINNVNNTPEIDEGDIKVGEVWIRYQYSRGIDNNYRFI